MVFETPRREVVMETAGLEIFLLLQLAAAQTLCYFNKLIFLKSFMVLFFPKQDAILRTFEMQGND